MTVEAAMKREIPIKTRASVLDAPTKVRADASRRLGTCSCCDRSAEDAV
jgi:hypothetical protein